MSDASNLIRDARHAAGLTQRELAKRLDMTQSAIAKLERPNANPTVATLDRVLRASGRRLQMITPAWGDFDIGLLHSNLELSKAERIELADALARDGAALQAGLARGRGRAA